MLYILILSGVCLPLTQQHLLYPVEYCRLSTACVHDGVPVCATAPTCCEHRTFLDQCDMYEYNCDYGTRYQQTYNLLCNGLIPHLMPKTTTTERTSSSKPSTAEISTTQCCDRPTLWDTTTTEYVDDTSPQDKVTSSTTTVKLTTTTTTPPFAHKTTATVGTTITPCCERPITWETTSIKIPYTQSYIFESIRPTISPTTQKKITTATATTPIITSTTTTSRSTTSTTTITKSTTSKTTPLKEKSSLYTNPNFSTVCCDRPKNWETTAYTEVVLTNDDTLYTTAVTPVKTIKTTNEPTSKIKKTTAYKVTSTKSLPSLQTFSETSKKSLETTTVPKTTNMTSSLSSSVCCDRPKIWETTKYSENVLTNKLKLSTATTPTKLTTQTATTTKVTTTTTTEITKTTPKYLPSTNTVSETYKSFKPTTFVETTLEATTACCERPKVWETTEATNTFESYEVTDASVTSLKLNYTTFKTTTQTNKKSGKKFTTEDLNIVQTPETNEKTLTPYDSSIAQTSDKRTTTFATEDYLTTQTSKTSEKTFTTEDLFTTQSPKKSKKAFTKAVPKHSITSKTKQKLDYSTKTTSLSNKQTSYDSSTSGKNSKPVPPVTKTVSADGDTKPTKKFTRTKSTNALTKKYSGKSVPGTNTKTPAIHTTSTWWYPTYCKNRKCEFPVWWSTTKDRRRKFYRRNDNKIPQ